MEQQRERRVTASKLAVEPRVDGNGPQVIEGYAALFNNRATIMGMFTESITPGAFSRAISEGDDCRCLFNHDSNQVLGRTRSGTLTLQEDSTGLLLRNVMPDTQLGRDVYTLIARGDISQQSFAFTIDQQQWTFAKRSGELDHREILSVRLFDAGPVTYPAYEDTSIGARSLIEAAYRQARAEYEHALLEELDVKAQGVSINLLAKRLRLLRLAR